MPRKPSLSPTKITTYLACPVKYKWTYVDERGKWYQRSKSYYSFGTNLHRVLQRFHDSNDAGVQTVDQALSSYEEGWIEAGFESPEAMAEAFAEGKSIVEQHVQAALERPSEATTLYVEKTMNADFGEFRLTGRMDRVDQYPDGTLEIVDYKSGRSGTCDDEVANDLAMGCYQLLMHASFLDRPIKATIIALRSGTRGTASFTPEQRERFREDLKAIGTEILNRDYENLVPVAKDLCIHCDFLKLCQRHPEFGELPSIEPETV